jgi:hypothetical protein
MEVGLLLTNSFSSEQGPASGGALFFVCMRFDRFSSSTDAPRAGLNALPYGSEVKKEADRA